MSCWITWARSRQVIEYEERRATSVRTGADEVADRLAAYGLLKYARK